ncbi:MAG TPA: hypothetical protein DEP05_04140, partial [Betaproteobacteria bacterium]|nr:hypothetical protein [Betaproteobacteria bacterium]
MKSLLFLVLMLTSLVAMAGQYAEVKDNIYANLRSGKAETYPVITVLKPKAKVEVLNTENRYAQIKTADGQEGWIALRLLVVKPPAVAAAAKPAPAPAAPDLSAPLAQCKTALQGAQQTIQNADERLTRAETALQQREAALTSAKQLTIVVGAMSLLVGFLLGMI